jgi:hypothetical protein
MLSEKRLNLRSLQVVYTDVHESSMGAKRLEQSRAEGVGVNDKLCAKGQALKALGRT